MSTTGRVQLILHKSEDKISMLPIQVSNCTEQYRLLIKTENFIQTRDDMIDMIKILFSDESSAMGTIGRHPTAIVHLNQHGLK